MLNTILRHKFLSVLILVAIIAVAWYELSASPSSSSSLITTSTPDSGPDQQLVTTLLTLRAVTLSGTILSDPAFRSLQDFTTQITPEPVGRTDPFAPIAGASVPQASSTPATHNPNLFAPKK
jgi:hypothetical protein